MKVRVFIASFVSILLLSVLAFTGFLRGESLGEKVFEAYRTSSIDEYLGVNVSVSSDICASLGKIYEQRLSASQAPKKLKTLVDGLQGTFESGRVSQDSFEWFKDEKFTARILYPVGSPLPEVIRNGLNFDPSLIRSEETEKLSNLDLDKRLDELRSKGQLPSGVNTSSWYESFNEKYEKTCGPVLDEATASSLESFESDVSAFSTALTSILTNKWESKGFEKVGPLVAYSGDIQASCSGSSSCAIFWVETATACEVEVTVDFLDDNNVLELTSSAKKFVSQAKSRTVMQVSAAGTGSGGYYAIQEATCK